jgi:hypothetical protein
MLRLGLLDAALAFIGDRDRIITDVDQKPLQLPFLTRTAPAQIAWIPHPKSARGVPGKNATAVSSSSREPITE